MLLKLPHWGRRDKQKAVLRQLFELFAQKKICLETDGGNGFLSTMLVLKDTDNGRTKMVFTDLDNWSGFSMDLVRFLIRIWIRIS